ncbi:MAG: calcium-binding protein, partial [Pseudomonadota bacterium]
MYGTWDDEFLYNADGDAILVGGGGNDHIIAGAGADILDGGAGGDTYILRRNSGQDKIVEFDSDSANFDTIWRGSNLTPDDVFIRRAANDLVLRIKDTDDSITVSNFFTQGTYINHVERIEFMDGTVWTDSDFLREALKPKEQEDYIGGGSGVDEIHGAGGYPSADDAEGADESMRRMQARILFPHLIPSPGASASWA